MADCQEVEAAARWLYEHDSEYLIRSGWDSDSEGLKAYYYEQVEDLLDRVRAEHAEGMVKLADVLAFLRAGTYYNPATGGDRAIPGWKNAADEVEREFGEASDGR